MSKTKTAPDAVKAQNAAALAQQQQRSEQQALDYFNAMDNFYLRQYSDEVNKEYTDQIQKDQFENALLVSDIRRDGLLRAFDQSEENYREQLLVNQAEFQRAEGNLQRAFDDTVRSYDDQLTDQARAFEMEQVRASFDQDRINRRQEQSASQFDIQTRGDELTIARARDQLNQRSAIRQADVRRQADSLQQDRADLETQTREIQDVRVQADLIRKNQEAAADLEEARALLSRDSQLSNIAFQREGQRIESLSRVGQARARGRKGRSADRSLQTTLALSGINVARLTNQAFFAQQEFRSAQESVANRKAAIGFQDEISKIREISALSQLSTRGQRLTTEDRYETAVTAAEAEGDRTESGRLESQEQLLADVALNRFSTDSAEYNQQLDEIAYAMGLSAEQLTMNQERLGDSLFAAAASLDDQLLALEQAKYKADYNAHAARMLPPEFAPDAKAPYDVPLPEYIQPRPGAAPAPPYQAQYIPPPTQSGLSQALMIGGAALSVAAIPFTLGASAAAAGGLASTAAIGGAFGTMTVGSAAAIGTGLAGAGGVLSQFSQQTYNYDF